MVEASIPGSRQGPGNEQSPHSGDYTKKMSLNKSDLAMIVSPRSKRILCPLLKFLEKHSDDLEHVKFQLKINSEEDDFAQKLGIPKGLNARILPDGINHRSASFNSVSVT